MPRNYAPITAPGTSRIRAKEIAMSNRYGQMPSITWVEEEQILMDDGSYRYGPVTALADSTQLAMPLHTPVTAQSLQEEFDLIDVDTGTVYGKMTGAMLLLAIQSYHRAKALQRDDAEAALMNPELPDPMLPPQALTGEPANPEEA